MRPLELDFARRPRVAPLGWGLLAGGVVLLLSSVWLGSELSARSEHLRQSVTAAELRLQGGPAQPGLEMGSTQQGAGMNELQRISSQMRRPWVELFSTLESLPLQDVALLSLRCDAHKGQLRISAEARNLEAMLDFHRRLEDSEALSDVSLLNHEIIASQPERPVLLNLQASWRAGDARL